MENKEYPRDWSIETWEYNGRTHYLTIHSHFGHYCGYVEFVKKPVIEDSYHGILTYVPVHGGLTYAKPIRDGGMIYGFDCNHLNDELNPALREKKFLKRETEKMGDSIAEAAKWEKEYLVAPTSEAKADIIQKFHESCEEEFDLSSNLGAMINVLCGTL